MTNIHHKLRRPLTFSSYWMPDDSLMFNIERKMFGNGWYVRIEDVKNNVAVQIALHTRYNFGRP